MKKIWKKMLNESKVLILEPKVKRLKVKSQKEKGLIAGKIKLSKSANQDKNSQYVIFNQIQNIMLECAIWNNIIKQDNKKID